MAFDLNTEFNKMNDELVKEITSKPELLDKNEYSDEILISVIKKSWRLARRIRNPSREVKLFSVRNRWWTIKDFKDPDQEMIVEAENGARANNRLREFNDWLRHWNKTHKREDLFTCTPFLNDWR